MTIRALLLTACLAASTASHLEAGETGGAAQPTTDSPAAPLIPLEERYSKLIEGSPLDKEALAENEKAFRDAAAEQPGDVRWKIAAAVLKRMQGDAKGSVEALSALAKANPNVAEIQNQLGQSRMATMSSDMGFMTMASVAGEAKDAWTAAVKIDPNHIMARYALAQYEVQARKQGGFLFGSYSKARGHGEALLKIPGPTARFWGLVALGNVAAAQEEWADMAEKFNAAEAIAPNDGLRSMVLSFHVNALVRDKKDAKAALPIVERAVASADAENFTVYYLRGSVRKELGDCAGASEDFRRVLEKNPDAQNTRLLLAQCCEQSGARAAAVLHYEEYVKRFPKGQRLAEAQTALKRLRKG
ncbi:MAG: tetratricopeptide repeat protein [Phycisphaerae bacterium]|nr:tetratricopeptide repeat protein [Phycisphaerae bacterium]